MTRERAVRIALALVLSLGAPAGLVACDPEDQKDIEEGVNDVQKGVEEGAEEVEKEIDEADTDGKDD